MESTCFSCTICHISFPVIIHVICVPGNLFSSLNFMYFRSLLWVGPALLFSTATAVCMLGWDGKVRTILSISMPSAGFHFPLFTLKICQFIIVAIPIFLIWFITIWYFLAVLIGALNDRLLLAAPTEINPRQKKGVEIRSCLVGLLEPLLIGFGTMQQYFEQKLDLKEILYQITSR